MKKIIPLAFAALITLAACEKENDELTQKPSNQEVSNNTEKFDYTQHSTQEIITIANPELSEKIYASNSRADDGDNVVILQNWTGLWTTCGDGSGDCIAPSQLCYYLIFLFPPATVTSDDGNVNTYPEGELVKALEEGPESVSFETLVENSTPGQTSSCIVDEDWMPVSINTSITWN